MVFVLLLVGFIRRLLPFLNSIITFVPLCSLTLSCFLSLSSPLFPLRSLFKVNWKSVLSYAYRDFNRFGTFGHINDICSNSFEVIHEFYLLFECSNLIFLVHLLIWIHKLMKLLVPNKALDSFDKGIKEFVD